MRGQSAILFKTGPSTQNYFFVCFASVHIFQHVHFLFWKSNIQSRHPDELRGKRTEIKKRIHRHVYWAKELRVKREHRHVYYVLLTISRIQQNVYKSQIATITLNVWNVDCDVVGTAFAHSQWILIALEKEVSNKKAFKKDR